jgi:hypothetical protein
MVALRDQDGHWSRAIVSDPLEKLPPISTKTWQQVSAHDTARDCEGAREVFIRATGKPAKREAWRWAKRMQRQSKRPELKPQADVKVDLATQDARCVPAEVLYFSHSEAQK